MPYKNINERKSYDKNYYILHKENKQDYRKLHYIKNKKIILNKKREYYIKNKKRILTNTKTYILKHKQQINQYNKEYNKNNKEKIKKQRTGYINKYQISKRKSNIHFKILCNLRSRIWHALFNDIKSDRTVNLLGCSIEEVKQHLEHQFKPGMNWSNYGHTGWHIDHIKPCAAFDLRKPEEQQKCFHYTNMQPLWATENLIKSDKF